MELSFCVLGCYPKTSRENFTRSDVGHPHDLFRGFLNRYAPEASVDILFISDEETVLPAGDAIRQYDGFLWTGSDLTIYQETDPRVSRQIAFARDLFAAGARSYGSCWGIQMAAMAAGGTVEKNPRGREWGIARAISRTDAGKTSALLAGKPDTFDAFIMHLDEVTHLPSGTANLAANTHTPMQAAIVEKDGGIFWATQYHPEYNLLEMGRLIKARSGPLVKEGFFPDEESVLRHGEMMISLHRDPDSVDLRNALAVGDDILDAGIRERELRNWVDFIRTEKRAGS